MNAEKFLKDSNLSSIADGDTLGLKVVYEDDVIYLMEKYHQSKVNNGALDDVIVSHLKALTKMIEDSHNYGFEDVLEEYINSL